MKDSCDKIITWLENTHLHQLPGLGIVGEEYMELYYLAMCKKI